MATIDKTPDGFNRITFTCKVCGDDVSFYPLDLRAAIADVQLHNEMCFACQHKEHAEHNNDGIGDR